MIQKADKSTRTYQKALYWPVWTISYITGWSKITRLFSPEQIVSNMPNNKLNYLLERRVYRQTKRLIREGNSLDERSYYIYKLIAIKYGWPYVKEAYDDV